MKRIWAWLSVILALGALPMLMGPSGGYPSFPRLQGFSAGSPCTKLHTLAAFGELCATTAPTINFQSTGGAADVKIWDFYGDSTGVFHGRTVNDAYTVGNDWIQVARTAGSPNTIAFGAPGGLSANGVDLTPTSGNFVATFDSACTVNPTATFRYQRVGNVVVVKLASVSGMPCTSNSVNFSTSGAPVPAAIRPSTTSVASPQFGAFVDNGVGVGGMISFSTAGNVVMARCTSAVSCTTGTFTSSGSKSIDVASAGGVPTFSYMLGNP